MHTDGQKGTIFLPFAQAAVEQGIWCGCRETTAGKGRLDCRPSVPMLITPSCRTMKPPSRNRYWLPPPDGPSISLPCASAALTNFNARSGLLVGMSASIQVPSQENCHGLAHDLCGHFASRPRQIDRGHVLRRKIRLAARNPFPAFPDVSGIKTAVSLEDRIPVAAGIRHLVENGTPIGQQNAMIKNSRWHSDDMIPNVSRREGACFHHDFVEHKFHSVNAVGNGCGTGHPWIIVSARRVSGP